MWSRGSIVAPGKIRCVSSEFVSRFDSPHVDQAIDSAILQEITAFAERGDDAALSLLNVADNLFMSGKVFRTTYWMYDGGFPVTLMRKKESDEVTDVKLDEPLDSPLNHKMVTMIALELIKKHEAHLQRRSESRSASKRPREFKSCESFGTRSSYMGQFCNVKDGKRSMNCI